MNNHYTYFLILAASLAGPLALSFDKKVAFYKSWKAIAPAIIIPAVFYISWDIYFTKLGVWSFNNAYITGIKIINLPLEEALFFFVVPYCCVFIYACIRAYFPKARNSRMADHILKLLGVILVMAGTCFYDKLYSAYTFLFCAAYIGIIYLFKTFFNKFDALSFLVAYAIILIPFLLVNGLLTSIPVVMYNDQENTGIRITTIPFEDIFYGMLLVMMNISIYEKLKTN